MMPRNRCLLLSLFLLGTLLIITKADECVLNSAGSSFLNTQHELYQNGQCYPCRPQCTACSSTTDRTCLSGNCEKYYYFNNTLQQCQRCANKCQRCTGSSISQCSKCSDGYYFSTTAQTCKACSYGAKTCTSSISISCISGFYFDSQSLICRKCSTSCVSCTSSSECLECESTYYLTNKRCSKCLVDNCNKCIAGTNCYQCKQGYMLNGSKCQPYSCSDQTCKQCKTSANSCSLCIQGYYLFLGKCYYGSSIMCKSGNQGSSFGKCSSCSSIGYTTDNHPSYCIPSVYSDTDNLYDYEYFTFMDKALCYRPQFFVSQDNGQTHSIQLVLNPVYRLDFEIRLVSTLGLDQIQIQLQQNKNNNSNSNNNVTFLNSFLSIQGQQTVNVTNYYCKSKTLIETTGLILHKITKSFLVRSLPSSGKINLIISSIYQLDDTIDTTNNSSQQNNNQTAQTSQLIYLSQIYMKKHLCIATNCQSCYSAKICANCKQGYFLEQFQCRTQCSFGYYTNKATNKCQYECSIGYYVDLETSTCKTCQLSCSQCKGLDNCQSCSSGYFLYNNLCLNYCPNNQTYPQTSTHQCQKCLNPCKTCSIEPSQCTSCYMGYLHESKCVSKCPDKYLPDFSGVTPKCSTCSTECQTCEFMATFCASCFSGMTLYEGKCYYQCPNGFYSVFINTNMSNFLLSDINNAYQMCQPCLKNCMYCTSRRDNCTKCYDGFLMQIQHPQLILINSSINNIQIDYLFTLYNSPINPYQSAGICMTVCPLMYFYTDNQNLQCKLCPKNCTKCTAQNQCLKCQSTSLTFLQNGQCLTTCTLNTVYMNLTTFKCQKCIYPCQTCATDFNGTKCLSCQNQYSFLLLDQVSGYGSCMLFCPQNYYRDKQLSICLQCPLQCRQCLSQILCTVCQQNYILNESNMCVQSQICTDNHYLTLQNECQVCSDSCKECDDESFLCTQCWAPEYLLVDEGVCYAECPNGYYEQNNTKGSTNTNNTSQTAIPSRICELCPSQCRSCSTQSDCTTCQWQYLLLNGQCLVQCPLSYYASLQPSSLTKVCLKCSTNCLNCVSSLICLECDQSKVMIENQCASQCLQGFYMVEVEKEIYVNGNANGSNIDQGNNNGTYDSDNNTTNSSTTDVDVQTYITISCLKCPSECQTCLSQSYCLQCQSGYFLYNTTTTTSNNTILSSQCILTCTSTFYTDTFSFTCQKCTYPCSTCSNQLVCLSCLDNLTLLNQQCVSKCPNTFYLSAIMSDGSRVCISCPIQCYICTSSAFCQSCNKGYYLMDDNSSCIASCPQKYYSNSISNKCQQCQKPCLTCNNTEKTCLTCVPQHYLRKNFCVSVCPIGTYPDKINYICLDCPPSCISCSNMTYCTSCTSGTYLYLNQEGTIKQCLSVCPSNRFYNSQSNTCQACYKDCKQCRDDKFTCTDCYTGAYLQRSFCVGQCSDFYFLNITMNKCMECPRWCKQCQNSTYCLQCSYGYLHQGTCLASCPQGTYEDKKFRQCQQCAEGCLKCRDYIVCQKCNASALLALYSTICHKMPCPQHMYYFIEENQCIQRCFYLTNQIQKTCHQYKCPSTFVLSEDGQNCLKSCASNQHVTINSMSQPHCQSNYLLDESKLSVNDLPKFTIDVIPMYNGLQAVVLFSYGALEANNLKSINNKLSFTLEIIPEDQLFVEMKLWSGGSSGSSKQIVSASSTTTTKNSAAKRLLFMVGQDESQKQQQKEQLISISTQLIKVQQNAAIFKVTYKNNNNHANPTQKGILQFENYLKIKAQMNNPYMDFHYHQTNIPPQNYQTQKSTLLYNYSQFGQYQHMKIVSIILMAISLVVYALQAYVSDKTKSYLFVNVIEFQQILFLLCFAPLNYPPIVEQFFQGFKIITGRIFLSEWIQQDIQNKSQLIISPWQYYKFAGDISYFENILDPLIILALIIVLMGTIKVISLISTSFDRFFEKITKNTVKIFQIYGWFFAYYLGLFSFINILYSPQPDYQVQQSLLVQIVSIVIVSLIFVSPGYIFYRQMQNKLKYDPGLNLQKRKIGVSIPLYQILRKILFVFFLTNYYSEAIYPICILLQATGLIFVLVYWYEPYRNEVRQNLAIAQQASLFIFFIELLLLALNPVYGQWIGLLVVIHAVCHIFLCLIYPFYCVYSKFIYQVNPQKIDITQGINQLENLSEFSKKNNLNQDKNENQQGQLGIGDSQSTKFNFMPQKIKGVTNSQQQSQANEADQSDQGEEVKKKVLSNVVRLAKKNTKKMKEFKNYAYSQDEQQDSQQSQKGKNQYQF